MALVSKSIPNLINGVSQQPPALRLPTQGETQENGLSDVVDGLKKRPPTKFLNKLVKVKESPDANAWTAGSALTTTNTETLDVTNCYITTYKRSQTEQYTVVIEPHVSTPVIYVYDINGNLNYQSGKASWKADGTWCQDNTDDTSYLANITKEEMTSTSVADATFIVNKSKAVEKASERLPPKNDPSALVFLKSVNYSREYKLVVTSKEGGGDLNASQPAASGSSSNASDQTALKTSTIIHGLRADLYGSQNFIGNTGAASDSTGNVDQQYFPPLSNQSNATDCRDLTLNSSLQGGAADASDLVVLIGGNTLLYDATNVFGFKWQNAAKTKIRLPGSYVRLTKEDTDDGDDYDYFWSRASVSITKIIAGQDITSGYKVGITPTGFSGEPYFILTANAQSNFGDFDVIATDDDGGSNLRVFKGVAKSFTDLPSACVDGYQLQVAGDNNKKEDNYYVKFNGGSGGGYWKETVGDGLKNDFNLTTMPHTLKQLVNNNDDLYFSFTQGTDAYGDGWASRKAGDDDTNPFPSFVGDSDSPSYINDIFFHRNRLGIISGENVIFSETSKFFNFFRTTVRGLLDSDPIDVAVSQNEVSELKAALPIQDSLLLFSELNQFTLSSSQLLTPAEVTIDQSTKFECDLRTSPVGAGNSVFFNTVGGNFAGVREYFTDGDTEIKDATLITSHVPEYLSGNVRKMAASTNEDMLICLTSSVKSEAYIYKWYNSNNERLQSSWSKWKFDKNVADVTFNNSDLYITFEDGSFEKMSLRTDSPDVTFTNEEVINISTGVSAYLSNGSFFNLVNIGTTFGTLAINPIGTILLLTKETVKTFNVNGTSLAASAASMSSIDEYGFRTYTWSGIAASFYTALANQPPALSVLVEGSVTFGGKKHEVLLDHRRKIVATTAINTTTALLALTPDANSTTQWIDHKGEILATGTSVQAVVNYLYDSGTSAIKTHTENGVATANHVTVGQPYSFKYQMSEQVFQPQQGDITQDGRFQLRNMTFNFNDTGTFVVTTASTGRAANVSTYTGRITGQAQNLLSYSAVVDNDSFKVGVQSQAKETDITITSDSHLPCVFQSAEYEAFYTLRSRRI